MWLVSLDFVVQKHGDFGEWEAVSREVEGRTPEACYNHWKKLTRKSAKSLPITSGSGKPPSVTCLPISSSGARGK